MQVLQGGGSPLACAADPVDATRAALDQFGVKVILMGPLAYGTEPALQGPMEAFLTQVAGAAPRMDEGAMVWSYTG
jgi:hypothetical protein